MHPAPALPLPGGTFRPAAAATWRWTPAAWPRWSAAASSSCCRSQVRGAAAALGCSWRQGGAGRCQQLWCATGLLVPPPAPLQAAPAPSAACPASAPAQPPLTATAFCGWPSARCVGAGPAAGGAGVPARLVPRLPGRVCPPAELPCPPAEPPCLPALPAPWRRARAAPGLLTSRLRTWLLKAA